MIDVRKIPHKISPITTAALAARWGKQQMLQTAPRPSEYVTASGRIDMGHVFRAAHRRVKAELANWRPSIFASEPPKYADLFREKLTSELYTAQIERRKHAAPLSHNPITGTEREYFGTRRTELSIGGAQ